MSVSSTTSLTCENDAERCRFAAFVNLDEDPQGRANPISLDSACAIHANSGSPTMTLSERKAAGISPTSATTSALERARLNLGSGGRRSMQGGSAVKTMAQMSRMRFTEDRTVLPALPAPDAVGSEEGADQLKAFLKTLGMEEGSGHLRAAGVPDVEGLLTLEEDEWETLVELCATASEPHLSPQQVKTLKLAVTPHLVGR